MDDLRRDDKYYFPDGNVIILVSKTLFKVHKYVLARDGSTFENMFSLDSQGPATEAQSFVQDGCDDEHPIVMHGDTEDQFRDLLWSLYALPQEIVEATSPKTQAHILKLANVASLTHKYHFSSTESWALRALLAYFPKNVPTVISLSTDTLIKVTEVAVLCVGGNSMANDLLSTLQSKWRALIKANTDLGLTISVMERLGIRDLCGHAYLSMLLQGREFWEKDPFLSPTHRIRLLSGYYNVSKLSDTLPDAAPQFTHHGECVYGPHVCNQYWHDFWRTLMSLDLNVVINGAVPRHDKLDIMSRLATANNIMQTIAQGASYSRIGQSFQDYVHCHKPAFTATVALCRKIENELLGLFHDPI